MSETPNALGVALYADAYERLIANVYAAVESFLDEAPDGGLTIQLACEKVFNTLHALAPVSWDHAMVDALLGVCWDYTASPTLLTALDGTCILQEKLGDADYVENLLSHLTLQVTVETYPATLITHQNLLTHVLDAHLGLVIHNPQIFPPVEVNRRMADLYPAATAIHSLCSSASEKTQAFAAWLNTLPLKSCDLPMHLDVAHIP